MKTAKKSAVISRPDSGSVKRILIVKPSSLGDIFHVFPAVARLGELFPEAVFDWVIHPAFAEALDYAPVKIGEKIIFRRHELGKFSSFLPESIRLAQSLRKHKYDYIFDFQGLLRSALCGFIANGPQVGFARPREASARWFYKHWTKVNLRLHAVRRNQLLVERFFRTGTMNTVCTLPENNEYHLSLAAKLQRLGIDEKAPVIGVSPGARWNSKVFPPELFAKVIDLASDLIPEAQFVIIGAPADQKLAERICNLTDCGKVYSLAGATSLGELVELIKNCRVLLANDSGPVHIAAAGGVPVVCFYGPTNPSMTGPFGDIHTIFQRGDLECIKCMHRQCKLPVTECHNIDAASAAAAIRNKIMEDKKLCTA